MQYLNKKNQSKADFSWMSSFYDCLGHVFLGGNLHRSQIALLDHLPQQPNSVLILGGGTGKFLIDLINHSSPLQITYVDISPGMIQKAKNKIQRFSQNTQQIEFICGELKDTPDHKYDLIITHYFLDCFTQNEFIIIAEEIKAKMATNAYWSMVDFHAGKQSTLFKKVVIKFLYNFFQMSCGIQATSLPDFESWFQTHFKEDKKLFFCKGLLKSSIYKNL